MLVLLAFLLLILIGMLGLVIDGGILMNSHRQAQNAADAAARACARRLQYEERTNGSDAINGDMSGVLQPTADLYALNYNRNWLSDDPPAGASALVYHPPRAPSPYATDLPGANGHTARRFVEVVVSYPVRTWFIHVLGIANSRLVGARAVAGYKSKSIPGGGLILLDPDGSPGLQIGGTNATVSVNAAVLDYSLHEGVNSYGDIVGTIHKGQPAAAIGGGGTLIAPEVYVSGGVDVTANFQTPNVGTLSAGTLSPVFDPFFNEGTPLPVPSTANGVVSTDRGEINVSTNQTVVLQPGLYSGISITGGNVTFQPGIYVLRPSKGGGNVLTINGGTVQGTGVMFYNTGSKYVATTGAPDTSDLTVATDYAPAQSDLQGEHFGGISINGPNVNFTPLNSGPFKNVLIYQRRFNTSRITINGGFPAPGGLAGVVYAKWANLGLAGSGTYNFGVVVGSASIQGNATITIPEGITPDVPRVLLLYLVE